MEMKVYFPGGKRVYADYGNFTIETDQPARGGGDDSAPAPFDLFLASIGTCAGIFALGFMQQRGIDPEGSSIAMSPQFDPERRPDHQDRPGAEAAGGLSREVQERDRQRDEPLHGQEAPASAARVRDRHHGRLMADHFDPTHAPRLEDPSRLEALPQSAVVDLLRLEGAETVVDYGAGTGIYTVAVAAAVPDGKVFAVEALPQLVELLRQKITPELTGRICVCETGDNVVPLDDGEADRVVMVDVLHHLYDQPEALEEVGRVLRSGGLFVVVDWGDTERPVGPPPGHVLGLDAVREIVAGMGLDVVETHAPGDLLPYHVVVVAAKP